MTSIHSPLHICRTNSVMRLLHQQNRHYPLEVIYRVFRDEYLLETPLDRFLAACKSVREELQVAEGGGYYTAPPHKQLETWCATGKDAEPWFSLTDDPRLGKMVTLRPAARKALEITLMSAEKTESVSSDSLGQFFETVERAAAQLKLDSAATIERLKGEIAERERRIAKIQQEGMRPLGAQEKERYAADLTRFLSDLMSTINNVPSRLRKNVQDARELFYDLDESHGAVVNEVLDCLNTERKRDGYQMLRTLSDIHMDARKRVSLEDALDTIISDCAQFMTERTRQEARTLFVSLTDIASRILSEDHYATLQVDNFINSETFERRKGQSRKLMELAEVMKAAAPAMRLKMTSGVEGDLGFVLLRSRVGRVNWFDLRLTREPPMAQIEDGVRAAPIEIDREDAQKRIAAVNRKSAYLESSRLKKYITAIVRKNGPTPLSAILRHTSLRYGLDELIRYMQIAMDELPAEFRPGWELDILIPDASFADPTDETSGLADAPRVSLFIQGADPVFLPDGQPGTGLVDTPANRGKRPRASDLLDISRRQAISDARTPEIHARRPMDAAC